MENDRMASVIYLVKVLTGLLILVGIVGTAVMLPQWEVSEAVRRMLIGVSVAAFAVLAGVVYRVYKKVDEFQKRLHDHASVLTIALVIALLGMAGVLQANGMVPLFNLFWVMGAVIAIWGVALASYDKRYK